MYAIPYSHGDAKPWTGGRSISHVLGVLRDSALTFPDRQAVTEQHACLYFYSSRLLWSTFLWQTLETPGLTTGSRNLTYVRPNIDNSPGPCPAISGVGAVPACLCWLDLQLPSLACGSCLLSNNLPGQPGKQHVLTTPSSCGQQPNM